MIEYAWSLALWSKLEHMQYVDKWCKHRVKHMCQAIRTPPSITTCSDNSRHAYKLTHDYVNAPLERSRWSFGYDVLSLSIQVIAPTRRIAALDGRLRMKHANFILTLLSLAIIFPIAIQCRWLTLRFNSCLAKFFCFCCCCFVCRHRDLSLCGTIEKNITFWLAPSKPTTTWE